MQSDVPIMLAMPVLFEFRELPRASYSVELLYLLYLI